jgi:hypothetical protein
MCAYAENPNADMDFLEQAWNCNGDEKINQNAFAVSYATNPGAKLHLLKSIWYSYCANVHNKTAKSSSVKIARRKLPFPDYASYKDLKLSGMNYDSYVRTFQDFIQHNNYYAKNPETELEVFRRILQNEKDIDIIAFVKAYATNTNVSDELLMQMWNSEYDLHNDLAIAYASNESANINTLKIMWNSGKIKGNSKYTFLLRYVQNWPIDLNWAMEIYKKLYADDRKKRTDPTNSCEDISYHILSNPDCTIDIIKYFAKNGVTEEVRQEALQHSLMSDFHAFI